MNSSSEILTANGWVVDIDSGTLSPNPLLLPTMSPTAISDARVVLGQGANETIRYDVHTKTLDSIDDIFTAEDINNVGEFCGYADITYTIRGRKTGTRHHEYRWGYGNDYDWLSDPAMVADDGFITGSSVNDSGDVVGAFFETFFSDSEGFLLYSQRDANGNEVGTTYNFKDLVDHPYLDVAIMWGNTSVTERNTSLTTQLPSSSIRPQ